MRDDWDLLWRFMQVENDGEGRCSLWCRLDIQALHLRCRLDTPVKLP